MPSRGRTLKEASRCGRLGWAAVDFSGHARLRAEYHLVLSVIAVLVWCFTGKLDGP